jgi:hypothetical protein
VHGWSFKVRFLDTYSIKINEREERNMEDCKFYDWCRMVCHAQKNEPRTRCHGDMTECECDDKCGESLYSVFKNHLRIHLRYYTKDYVRLYIADDKLIIEFYHLGKPVFTDIEMNINEKLVTGISTEELALKIIKRYKAVILNQHFYR